MSIQAKSYGKRQKARKVLKERRQMFQAKGEELG